MSHVASLALLPDQDHARSVRRTASLADKVVVAFHAACDRRDVETAQSLLDIFESMVSVFEDRSFTEMRRTLDVLIAAHERLWHLKNPIGRLSPGGVAWSD